MKIPLQIKILLWYHSFFQKRSNLNPLIKISSKGKGVKNILYFLPSERKAAQVISHFIKRNRKNGFPRFKYVIQEKGLFYYNEIPNDQIITYTDNDINWFGVIKPKSIIEKISSESFDALIDLNQSYDYHLCTLNLKLKIPIKVGFHSPISHQLYSIVIEPDKNGFVETNYLMIEKILNLS
tara:strand:+ start:110 stop:652 length:543 start_codon:yes stop_codon:yes gene_type:complete